MIKAGSFLYLTMLGLIWGLKLTKKAQEGDNPSREESIQTGMSTFLSGLSCSQTRVRHDQQEGDSTSQRWGGSPIPARTSPAPAQYRAPEAPPSGSHRSELHQAKVQSPINQHPI